MNAIEKLIRQKLKEAIRQEKVRIAGSLLETDTTPPKVQAGKGRPAGKAVIPPEVAKGHRRQALRISIQDKAQKVKDVQRRVGKSRDQQKAHVQLSIARQKLALDKTKLRAIK